MHERRVNMELSALYKNVIDGTAVDFLVSGGLNRRTADDFFRSAAGKELTEHLANFRTAVQPAFVDLDMPVPSIGLHQCRSLLNSLLNLRAEHRNSQRELLISQETEGALVRAVAWADDIDRLKRIENKISNAKEKLRLTKESEQSATLLATKANTTYTNLYSSPRATTAIEVHREVSNLSTMTSASLEAPTLPAYVDNILQLGANQAHVKVVWGAIGEGQKILYRLEQERSAASAEEYILVLQQARINSSVLTLDSADQLDAANEAKALDIRNCDEAVLALRNHRNRANDFSAAYAYRIGVTLKEYVEVANELENRLTWLRSNLENYGINVIDFFANDLFDSNDSDEKILSEVSISLARAALNYEDFESHQVHVQHFLKVNFETDATGIPRAKVILEIPAMGAAWLEGISLSANNAVNCNIEIIGNESTVNIEHGRIKEIINRSIQRTITSYIEDEKNLIRSNTWGGAFSNARLPVTFYVSLPADQKLDIDELKILAMVRGIYKTATAQ
jgi:hypothetical protein